MKLYISAASPFARKVRVLLLEKRVPHEVEVLNLWEPNDLQRTNPIGKVPTLVLDDGRVLISSALIADWIDERFPQPRFIPAGADTRLEVRCWEAVADGVMDAVAASSYELRFHDEACRSAAWLERQRGKVDAGLAALEARLGGRRWLCGDGMSLADIAIGCHLGFVQARMPHLFDAAKHPGLVRLARELGERPSFTTTAPPPL
jgi:glutathione S-transferase